MKNRPAKLIKRTKLPILHRPDTRILRLLVCFHKLREIYTSKLNPSPINCDLETKLCVW